MQWNSNKPLTPETKAVLTRIFVRVHRVLASRDVRAAGASTASYHIMETIRRAWRSLADDR